MLSLKSISRSLSSISLLYVSSIVLCSIGFMIIEDRTFIESIWWSFVTSLTIGYGDISPVTVEGRILTIVFAHFWIFGIIPLVVANILTKVIENRDAFTHEEQEEIKLLLKELRDRV